MKSRSENAQWGYDYAVAMCEEQGISYDSKLGKASTVADWCEFVGGREGFATATAAEVASWFEFHSNWAHGTKKQQYYYLKTTYDYAISRGDALSNPFKAACEAWRGEGERPQKPSPVAPPVEPWEIAKILKTARVNADTPTGWLDHALTRLHVACCISVPCMMNANVCDFEDSGTCGTLYLTLPRYGTKRVESLDAETTAAIRAYLRWRDPLSAHEPLFTAIPRYEEAVDVEQPRRLSVQSAYTRLRKIYKWAEVKVDHRSFKHGLVRAAEEAGASPQELVELSQHRGLSRIFLDKEDPDSEDSAWERARIAVESAEREVTGTVTFGQILNALCSWGDCEMFSISVWPDGHVEISPSC